VPVPDALAIARQLANALEGAHERGVVHRDLKPANVKLSPSQGVKLLDFGLATERLPIDIERDWRPEGGPFTSAGLILGTCDYMSPESS
jgi:eukaryotic-like serine/threonine-protein kinase